MTDVFDSVVLITSTDEDKKKFGSGFAFYREANAVLILTCAHVVEDVGGEHSVLVEGQSAEVLACGKSDEVDMAVLRVTGMELPPLAVGLVGKQDLECSITGFAPLSSSSPTRRAESLHGKLGGPVVFATSAGRVDVGACG